MNLGGTAGTAGAASAGGASGQPNGTGGLGSSGAASGAGGDGGTPANAAGRSGAAGQGSSGAGQGGGTSGTGGSASGTFSICSSAPPSGTRVVSVYVIGDSTASIYTSDVYPRTGWAQVVGDAFSASCAVVKDKALSGRSSKSFSDEGAFTPVQSALAAGDFLLIQFGHNDEKSDDPAKYTEPQTTYKQYLTTYVNAARAKQAVPILLTPISRNQWSGATLADTHGAYPAAVRELAASLDVPLVDMTRLTKQHFERIGQAATTVLFMNLTAGEFPNYPSGNSDNTHLRETGARVVAQLFVSDAYSQRLAVASGLAAVPVAP